MRSTVAAHKTARKMCTVRATRAITQMPIDTKADLYLPVKCLPAGIAGNRDCDRTSTTIFRSLIWFAHWVDQPWQAGFGFC
jgi:hypothetical protein